MRGFRAFLATLSFALPAYAAPTLPGNAQLGMSADQLQDAVASARRVARPARMTGGLVGSWSAGAVDVAGVPFTPTFFFADGALRRVEYVAAAVDASAAFDAVRAWARAQWGAELVSQNPEATYATWSTDDMDVYLQMTSSRDRPELRLVVKSRVLKDASEL